MRNKFTKWIIIIAFLISPALSLRLSPNVYEGGRSKSNVEECLRNSSAISLLLGEIRSIMSDFMFIKTERYHDNGIAYLPHLEVDALPSKGELTPEIDSHSHEAMDNITTATLADYTHDLDFEDNHKEHQHAHDHLNESDNHEIDSKEQAHDEKHEHVMTIIRTKSNDFRGFIGNLEREVKPWRDPSLPHQHTPGTELLPWYRLMTLADPHNVKAYLIGSWWLKAEKTKVQLEEAIKFAEEGIKNNPNAFQLYLMRGEIYRDLKKSADALQSFKKGAELAAQQRPPEGDKNPNWSLYQEEDARAVMRFAVIMERMFGDKKEALDVALYYLEQLGGKDDILIRQIQLLKSTIK